MLNPLSLLPVAFGQAFYRQTLKRTPEPEVMDSPESVAQYEDADKSKLAIVYAAVLDRVHRMKTKSSGGRAIDLCCGPGHFTLMLAKYFNFDEVIGVDRSDRMLENARKRIDQAEMGTRVKFVKANATDVPFESNSFDVVTCNDAAHHLPNLKVVRELICEMERLSSATGICVLSDLVRLKTERITELYTKTLGEDYPPMFYNDFCNSMRAAWTETELASAIPNQPTRTWYHQRQSLVPTVQLLLGNMSEVNAFVRRSPNWLADAAGKNYKRDLRLSNILSKAPRRVKTR
ncbi:class I SAM-dependent methyltransferase [Roseiconus lacunae]|uniref:class I SAM-dependent methyltransferase n=1 Tax=Roseiconus lacunae TaxID=2605694 RepID=UPI00135B1B93|nr:class I SAM-dependent methyltransferase [Roseiconus lacunae]